MKALVSSKKMGLSIFSVELRTKKSYSTEYILSCVGGGDLRIFSQLRMSSTLEYGIEAEYRTQLVSVGPVHVQNMFHELIFKVNL